jgi:hypothetical protein
MTNCFQFCFNFAFKFNLRCYTVVDEGAHIYARKPNMGEHDVTWSQREYAHLGLQKEYIKLKSVQRLTEAGAYTRSP